MNESLCPGCGKPASRVQWFGWLFQCDGCKWNWGHPQATTRVEALQALLDARNSRSVT